MYEDGEPSEGFPMVDLSSQEEDTFFDTSQDEEIARKLFGDLNCGLLGLPDDGNVIVLNDSDEEEEVREDDCTDVEATSSDGDSSAPTTSAATDDDTLNGVQDDSSDGGDMAGSP
jgi:hypothetical protein